MLKVVSRGRRKAHTLRFLLQTRRFSRTMSPHRESQYVFFTVDASGVITTESNARTGKLTLKGRKGFDTPNFLGICSRGAIPHITPDVLSEHTEVEGVHMALEDCEFEPP
jgi:hypothetical protein